MQEDLVLGRIRVIRGCCWCLFVCLFFCLFALFFVLSVVLVTGTLKWLGPRQLTKFVTGIFQEDLFSFVTSRQRKKRRRPLGLFAQCSKLRFGLRQFANVATRIHTRKTGSQIYQALQQDDDVDDDDDDDSDNNNNRTINIRLMDAFFFYSNLSKSVRRAAWLEALKPAANDRCIQFKMTTLPVILRYLYNWESWNILNDRY